MTNFLIVDDNEIWTVPTVRRLRRRGESVDYVTTARDALQKLSESSYDVAIVDASTDVVVRGRSTLADVLKEDFPSVRRIGISAIANTCLDPVAREKYDAVIGKSNDLDLIYQAADRSPTIPYKTP